MKKLYTTTKVLFTTRLVELIEKKGFIVVALDPNNDTFIVYIISLPSWDLDVYLSCRVQIISLKADGVFTTILSKYTDFIDIFSSDLIVQFLKHTKINNYATELIDSKHWPYEPIYSLRLVDLEILKLYIKIKSVNGFIRLSMLSINTLILFI